MRWALLIAVALLSGCAAEPFELELDERFTPAERAVIQARAEEWLSTGASIGRVVVLRETPHEPGRLGGSAGQVIRIRPDVKGETLSIVALHEFGHHAGADHHEGEGCMRESITAALPCITPDDLALVGIEGPGTCGGDND